jgi:hypothetical protein
MALKLGTLEVDINGDTSGLKMAEGVVEKSSKRINTNLKAVDTTAKNTGNAIGGIGRRSGQAGIQLQQFIGQVQGGQNAMLALSQQSADLGFVLGAPLLGAVVGISASIAGLLLPSLFESKDATEQLEEAMKSLDDVAVETGDGVEILSKKLIELAKKSQQAARAEIQSGIVTAMDAMKTAAEGADEVMTDLFGSDLRSNGTNALFLKETINDVAESLKISSHETGGLVGALRILRNDPSPENIENLQKKLDSLAISYGETSPEVVKLAGQIRKFSLQATSAKERVDFLKTAFIDIDEAIAETERTTGKGTETLDKYIKSLEAQLGALGLAGEELYKYEANLLGATEEERNQIIAIREKIQAFEDAKKAMEEDVKAREAAQKRLDQVRSGGLDEGGKIQERFEDEQEALEESLRLKQITQDEYRELEKQAEQRQTDSLLEIDKRRQTEQLQLQQQGLSNLAMFHSAATDLIQAAGKEGTAIAKAAFLAGKAIQVAQIIAATEVAAIQASAAVAAGGPVPVFATAGSIRALGYASAGIVAGLSVAQSFEQGGIVGGHSMTGDRVPARVNSGEMILTTRQQQKLFAMANGAGGDSGSAPSVNIINNGAPVEVQSQSISREEVTLMINNGVKSGIKQVNQSLATGRGDTSSSLQKGFKAERRL